MPSRRVTRQQLTVDGDGLALSRDASEEDAAQNAAHVRVGERHAPPVREARDGTGGVRPMPGSASSPSTLVGSLPRLDLAARCKSRARRL